MSFVLVYVCVENLLYSEKKEKHIIFFNLFSFWHNIVTIFSTGSSSCSSVSLDARVVHKCLIRFESLLLLLKKG